MSLISLLTIERDNGPSHCCVVPRQDGGFESGVSTVNTETAAAEVMTDSRWVHYHSLESVQWSIRGPVESQGSNHIHLLKRRLEWDSTRKL